MKTKLLRSLAALLFLSTLNSPLSTAFGQGALTPPGAPAPTMKTLAQVEPRTPISAAPFTVTNSGSYYLTTNLTGTVTINADNVTLDLMGFAIVSTSGDALTQSGAHFRILVRNGIISAPGFNGIDFSSSTATAESVLEDLRVYGCQNYGLAVGGGYQIHHCQVNSCGLAGIRVYGNSDIQDCTVTGCGVGLQASATGAHFAKNTVHGNTDNYNFTAGNQLDLLLSEVPESIDWPALVTLAGSLTVNSSNAIVITANGVTLDLSGFTISSTVANAANGGTAILLAGTATAGLSDITIVNGHIRSGVTNNGSGGYIGSGFNYGIYYSGSQPVNTRVSGVSVAGCLNYGIYLNFGNSTVVEACTVRTVGGNGIEASTIKGSVAVDCGSSAIAGDQVSDCRGQSTGGTGIYASYSALNCSGSSSSGYGLSATTANNCVGYRPGGTAILATVANGCYAPAGVNLINYIYNMP